MPPSRASQLIGWYVALLLPTLYVKHRFMLMLSRWWVDGSSTEHLSDGEIASWARLWVVHIAPADVIEVACFVLLLWLVGHLLFRVSISRLATLSVALAMVVLGFTLVSLRETGALITGEAVSTTWRWVSQDGQMPEVTARQALLAACAALWIATPVVFARMLGRVERSFPRLRFVAPGVVVCVTLGAAVARPDVFVSPPSVSLSRGLWSSALMTVAREASDRPRASDRSTRELQDAYFQLVYPTGRPPTESPILDIPAAARRPRHLLFVILETAPRQFYRLIDNPELPSLQAMSRHALVSDHHYTAAPRSDVAVFSIISGTYSRPGAPIYEFGRFMTDGLATVLGKQGYRSTYIDSLTLRWNVREEALAINDLGFPTIIEESDVPLPAFADPFEGAVARERMSLGLGLDAIIDADQHGQRALAVVATSLGHFPWRAPALNVRDAATVKVARLARAFDGLMAESLARLETHHLSNDVVIVIVGDHGLRFSVEFESFNAPIRHGDLMFNVPLMIYAPAALPETVRLPWVTSHVDIAPTILGLLGLPRDDLLLHGENMLDRRLAERVTLLPSGMFAPMYPVDGLHYRGEFYTWAYALDRVRVRPGVASASRPAGLPALSTDQVREILRRSRDLLDETATHFIAAAKRPSASDGSR